MLIKIGTRKSKLAMWQAYYVRDLLNRAGLETELVPIESQGDKVLSVSIAGIGSKGVFTAELEQMLLDGGIDIAVHSAKDLPSALPEHFEIIAFTDREKVHDVLVSNQLDIALKNSSDNLLIGTSSTRRIAMLRHYYPGVKTIDVRGNLQTRISKMEGGLCDALLLAYAGVKRMDYGHMIREELNPAVFTPAAGQGSLAVEVSGTISPDKKELLKKLLNHPETEECLRAERAFLHTMEGGCNIPVFVLARLIGRRLQIGGGVVSLDGKRMIRKQIEDTAGDPEISGRQLAELVLRDGGSEILFEIKDLLS
jgi:hydroxymethylbilane synthase